MTPDECVNYLAGIGETRAADALRRRAASIAGALRAIERLADDCITPAPSLDEQRRVRERVLAESVKPRL